MVEALITIQAVLCFLPWLFVVRRQLHPLSAPVFVGLLFAAVYVAQSVSRALGGVKLISWEMLEFGLLVSILALAAFYLGWLWEVRRKGPARHTFPQRQLDPQRLLRGALGFAALAGFGWLAFIEGSGGATQFYSETHGRAGNWLGVTGYVYNLPGFVAPSVCMLLIVAYVAGPKPRGILARRLAIAFTVAWLVHVVLMGSRMDFFRIASPWMLFLLARHGIRKTQLAGALTGLLLVAVAFQFLVGFRDFLHLGASDSLRELTSPERWQEALTYNTFVPKPDLKGNTEIDYHCAETFLFWRSGEYTWGAALLNPIINFLPRHLFPEKPYIRTISRHDVLFRGVGWIPNPGSCPTGPGEMFTEFGFFSLLFWFLIGALVAKVDTTIAVRPDLIRLGYYAAALCGLLHLVLQSYGAGFMAFVFFAGPLWVTFRYARSGQIARTGRAVRLQQTALAPGPARPVRLVLVRSKS